MNFRKISVKNYKGLRDTTISLSNFACIIGHNNSGKSSLIQSIILFIEGKRLSKANFYDPDREVEIFVELSDISENDLELIVNIDHRQRIRSGLQNSILKLVRRYNLDGVSKVRWVVPVPVEERFHLEDIDLVLKGKRPGSSFAEEIASIYPELQGKIDSKTNQSQARNLINELINSLPDESLTEQETDLPTGYDASVRSLLPEPIYIPAVKDFSDDIKTKESTSFGKLIGILLSAIAPELSEADKLFKDLNKKLNTGIKTNGEPFDDRFDAVRRIESTIQTILHENFPNVDLELLIPPPEIKTILSSAHFIIDDGIKGDLESKGDGLKRSLAFAILRSIAQLKRDSVFASEASKQLDAGFILLFEEPELYLHPKAQRTLFDALRVISGFNQVVVCTHSPLFFSPNHTDTFVKMVKIHPTDGQRPFGQALPIDLSTMDQKARFQILNFEINNIAFFGQTVVLVEGDTDHIIFPHIARTLNPEWCVDREEITICRVNGKFNIRRYKTFLANFKVRVIVLADLDCLLDGFDMLGASDDCARARSTLINRIDALIYNHIKNNNSDAETEESKQFILDKDAFSMLKTVSPLKQRDIKNIFASTVKKGQWDDLVGVFDRALRGDATIEELKQVGESFFDKQITRNRQSVLQESGDTQIEKLKHAVLIALRECDVFLLSRGAIEAYLPQHITGDDKPSRAIEFCSAIKDRDSILSLSDEVPIHEDGSKKNELEWVFSLIFGRHPVNTKL